jgi:1-acyl-sn-glycerol-3-phosphate acyltransferase
MRAPDAMHLIGAGPDLLTWRRPAATQIVGSPLPHLGPGDRVLLRVLAMYAVRHIVAIGGLQHIRPAHDPFILVANHSTRRESLLVPAMLLLHRGGSRVHFLADWNFRLIPGVGFLYARARVITVTRKSAKPRLLNVLKRLYQYPQSTLERARAHLVAGRAVGIFPEGEVNRNPTRLLRGRHGAARLSVETGVPVVPMGIRFPGGAPGPAFTMRTGMELQIGAPLLPPGPIQHRASLSQVRAWHGVIMSEIARLSGKAWASRKGDGP